MSESSVKSFFDGISQPKERAILFCGILSLIAFGAVRMIAPAEPLLDRRAEIAAARTMEKAIRVLRDYRVSHGKRFDDAVDPNHTGLIGAEYTEITTTAGTLEAKRTTTNPNMASLLVQLLAKADVVKGDTIALGCSGSFPALAIATLAASNAIGVHPVMILSLGSSSYGATEGDLTLLDILGELKKEGVIDVAPAAVSVGGAKDVGHDLEPQAGDSLREKIRRSGIPLLSEPDLQRNVAERMRIYLGPLSNRRIAAFVNIGGSYADLGTDPLILKLEPGVNKQMAIPPAEEKHGVVFAMAKQHIPVIHLLHIKGLALKYGLPWDPIPLPAVTSGAISQTRSAPGVSTIAVAAAYFSLIIVIFAYHRKEFFRTLF